MAQQTATATGITAQICASDRGCPSGGNGSKNSKWQKTPARHVWQAARQWANELRLMKWGILREKGKRRDLPAL